MKLYIVFKLDSDCRLKQKDIIGKVWSEDEDGDFWSIYGALCFPAELFPGW